MALNFPSNPTLNQEYTSGTKTWFWNGSAWQIKPAVVVGQSGYSGYSGYSGFASPVVYDAGTPSTDFSVGVNVNCGGVL